MGGSTVANRPPLEPCKLSERSRFARTKLLDARTVAVTVAVPGLATKKKKSGATASLMNPRTSAVSVKVVEEVTPMAQAVAVLAPASAGSGEFRNWRMSAKSSCRCVAPM